MNNDFITNIIRKAMNKKCTKKDLRFILRIYETLYKNKLNNDQIIDIINEIQYDITGIDTIVYNFLIKSQELDIDIIDRYMAMYLSYSNWNALCYYQKLPMVFINRYINEIDFIMIGKCQNINLTFVDKYKDKLNMQLISENENIDKNEYIKIIEKYKDDKNISWFAVSCRQLPTDFIIKHKEKLYISAIIYNKKFNDDFIISCIDNIKEFIDKLNIEDLTLYKKPFKTDLKIMQ